MLSCKPYTFKENGQYIIHSAGKHHLRVDCCDVFFEGKFVFENKGLKQTEKLTNLLNGAFLCGKSDASSVSNKSVRKHNPYTFKETYCRSPLVFFGILGHYVYEIFFEEDRIETRGDKKQAEELTARLNLAYAHGVSNYFYFKNF